MTHFFCLHNRAECHARVFICPIRLYDPALRMKSEVLCVNVAFQALHTNNAGADQAPSVLLSVSGVFARAETSA